jgi:pyruvate dehydrogenase E2 component (dihydrolipoamide acetyltransferase)
MLPMSHEIVMPQMGMSMDSGIIIRWLKQPGAHVVNGELLLEVEGDKATVEVEAAADGLLEIVAWPNDGPIPVGKVIGYLLTVNEVRPNAVPQPAASATAATGPTQPLQSRPPSDQNTDTNPTRTERLPASPAARRRAQELGVDWRHATGTGPQGAVKERDVVTLAATLQASQAHEKVRISPVARRVAEAAGLDAEILAGRQAGKRLERADVERAIQEQETARRRLESHTITLGKAGRRQPMSHLRMLIAERLAHSARTTAGVTLTTEADATDFTHLREGLRADSHVPTAPSYSALMAKLVAKALVEHPALNASIEEQAIVYWQTVNIGIAVDTERGLLVPVTRDVQDKPLQALTREIDERLARAKDGKATPDELTGGTFTITNLGMYDIDAFTPIINPPECAILGVGRLVERVVPVNSVPAVRTMMALSLTFDHRLVDGAPAARFLQRVRQLVQQPYLWLF